MNIRMTVVAMCLVWSCATFAAAAAQDADASPAKEKPADTPEALIEQIEAIKPPRFDASKRGDQEYQQSYQKEMEAAAKKRVDLANKFIVKYPDHPRKADVLFLKAITQMRGGGPEQQKQFGQTVEQFVRAAPKDERGARLLMTVADMERDPKKSLQILKRIVQQYPDSEAIASARGRLRQTEGVGKPFELEFTDAVTGKKLSMADLKGKVVVIDFWATWCGPCVAEMPAMKELYAKYKDKGVEFIGVSLDSPEEQGGLTKLKEFVAQHQIPWPQYYQGKGWESEFSRSWGINSIPAVFVVDADGKLHSTRARGKLEQLIPQLLNKRGQASAR